MIEKIDSPKAKGGLARAQALSPEQRREIAQKAALSRWDANLPKATHGSPDHPLRIGDAEISCYVLEGGMRVLSQRGLQSGIGMSTSGGSKTGEQRIVNFFQSLSIKCLHNSELLVRMADLAERMRNPIKFNMPRGGKAVYGYEATILADICDALLEARKIGGILLPQQAHIADQCEILVRGFARIGIIALVDEATGYQEVRDRLALQTILDKYLSAEKAKWAKTFPDDFYKKIFHLMKWKYDPSSVKRPGVIGHYTNDWIYDRIAPGVLKRLKELNPKTESGSRKDNHTQFFTSDYGVPELKEHIVKVMFLMDAAPDKETFKSMLNRASPRHGDTLPLDF